MMITQLHKEMDFIMKEQHLKWIQRAKEIWLTKERDRPSIFTCVPIEEGLQILLT